MDGKNSSTAAVQHIPEIRKLKMELEQERNKLAKIRLEFQGRFILHLEYLAKIFHVYLKVVWYSGSFFNYRGTDIEQVPSRGA